eukprot:5955181-Prymnesium_polylepis.3
MGLDNALLSSSMTKVQLELRLGRAKSQLHEHMKNLQIGWDQMKEDTEDSHHDEWNVAAWRLADGDPGERCRTELAQHGEPAPCFGAHP